MTYLEFLKKKNLLIEAQAGIPMIKEEHIRADLLDKIKIKKLSGKLDVDNCPYCIKYFGFIKDEQDV